MIEEELSKEAQEVREIMAEWAREETWRETDDL